MTSRDGCYFEKKKGNQKINVSIDGEKLQPLCTARKIIE